jgi:Golgi phosphoprotein 3
MRDDLTLPEQFLLLCLNDESGRFEECWVDYGLNAAALAELALRGRIRIGEKDRVSVDDPSDTGDDLLARALARLTGGRRPQRVGRCVAGLYRGRPSARQAVLQRLIARGILTIQEGRFLWVFPRTLYPAVDSAPENELRARLREALLGDAPVEQRLAVLIAILQGCDALDRILTRSELKRQKERIQAVVAGDPIGRAIGKAVSEVVAAAVAAMAAASAAAASG